MAQLGSSIKVDFDKLDLIIEDMITLKNQLNEVCVNYSNTIGSLAIDDSTWEGVDKDYYINQKNEYVNDLGDVSSALDTCVSYLSDSIEGYKKIENELSSKEI